MSIDRYTKVVLTVIAVCLVWISVRDVRFVATAQAGVVDQNQVVKVQIVSIDEASTMRWEPLPVAIRR